MRKKLSAPLMFAAVALAATALAFVPGGASVARADDVVGTQSPPVLTIHSTGGTISIAPSDDSNVRVNSISNHTVSRFDPNQLGGTPITLPGRVVRVRSGRGWRTYELPPRQFVVPAHRFGNEGVNVENPGGGDMSIGVPKRVGAIFINAEAGNVNIERLHGPYIIQATGGDVQMKNSGGNGLIRTTSGDVKLSGVSGNVHIQTANGAITVYGSNAERADISTQGGKIEWRFARVGTGPYHFQSSQGTIHLAFRPGVAAQVDAQSYGGSVYNLFAGTADAGNASVLSASQHAISIAVNGGGPEITVTSMSGDISIGPVPAPKQLPNQ